MYFIICEILTSSHPAAHSLLRVDHSKQQVTSIKIYCPSQFLLDAVFGEVLNDFKFWQLKLSGSNFTDMFHHFQEKITFCNSYILYKILITISLQILNTTNYIFTEIFQIYGEIWQRSALSRWVGLYMMLSSIVPLIYLHPGLLKAGLHFQVLPPGKRLSQSEANIARRFITPIRTI